MRPPAVRELLEVVSEPRPEIVIRAAGADRPFYRRRRDQDERDTSHAIGVPQAAVVPSLYGGRLKGAGLTGDRPAVTLLPGPGSCVRAPAVLCRVTGPHGFQPEV